MRFVLDTYRDVAFGGKQRRIHAVFTFLIWFAAGAYLFSSLGVYIEVLDGQHFSVMGGLIVSALVAAIKFT
jgi:hypothetical protein